MCSQCNRAKGFGSPNFEHDEAVSRLLDELAQRVACDPPIRCCDDPLSWDWRAYLAERRDLMAQRHG